MIVLGGRSYTKDDVLGTLGAVGPWWQQLTVGRAPVPELASLADRLATALRPLAGPGPSDGDLVALGTAARTAAAGAPWDTDRQAMATAALREVVTTLAETAATLRSAGALPATATGTVAHLHCSDGGVPKTAVDAVDIGLDGVAGDRQATRKHHGRPWQALCLWSTEVLTELQAEGHPIHHGDAGENVTLQGLRWADVRTGVRLRLGSEVLVEVSLFALPCAANAAWFLDRRFDRMHHDRGPVSRVYATVLAGGRVHVGDEAVIEP